LAVRTHTPVGLRWTAAASEIRAAWASKLAPAHCGCGRLYAALGPGRCLRAVDAPRSANLRCTLRPSRAERGPAFAVVFRNDAPDHCEQRGERLSILHCVASLDEPRQIIVVVNGTPLDRYAELAGGLSDVTGSITQERSDSVPGDRSGTRPGAA